MRLTTLPLQLMSELVSASSVHGNETHALTARMLLDYVEYAVVPTVAAAPLVLMDKCCLRKHVPLLVQWQFIPSGPFAGQLSTVSCL